jgi:hypothetical protein
MLRVFWRTAGLIFAALILAFSTFVVWQDWREGRLRSFCESVHVGMSVTNMLLLQRRYGIGESLLNPYDRDVLHKRISDRAVEFIGGYPGDPDFVCSIGHNGKVVVSAEIVP